jgi:type III restriction enzyme
MAAIRSLPYPDEYSYEGGRDSRPHRAGAVLIGSKFFSHPILNSPYAVPQEHWELEADGLPTQRVLPGRRPVRLITPIPKPKKQSSKRIALNLHELSTEKQQIELGGRIEELRQELAKWRARTDPKTWQVTPDTARLLQHWRAHDFQGPRPFFCQIEAVETVIWLTEVAPNVREGKRFLEYLESAREAGHSPLLRLALKLATGSGKTTVMAMIIAWQTVNAVRHPQSKRFTRAFLIVTPGHHQGPVACIVTE